MHAKRKLLEQICKRFAFNKVNRRCSVTRRFAPRIRRKSSGGDDQTFIRAPNHCAPKIPNNY